MEQQNRTQKDTTKWSGRKSAIAAQSSRACAGGTAGVCMAVHAKKHGDNNKGKYAVCAAREPEMPNRSNNCKLSNIDVSASKSKDVVFCVYSEKPSKSYDLQLAHTTNIGFTYKIYTATLADSNASTDVVECLGKKYKKGDLLPGSYLNIDANNRYATDAYHKETYGDYTKSYVQQSAEPLYWKTSSPVTLPDKEDDTGYYVNYYILHITWGDDVQNNKETDMIYLMAG